jgi:hypothetical protein
MVTLRTAPGSGRLAPAGKHFVAGSMYQKGKSFLGAALELHSKPGHEYVTLHLLCQGIENLLKGLLVLKAFDKYNPLLTTTLRHNLERLEATVRQEFGLRPPNSKLAREFQHLSRLYSSHLLRYGNVRDIFVDASTIQSDRVWRRVATVLRLAERHLSRVSLGPKS